MATLTINGDRVRLGLTPFERVFGLSGDIDVPLTAVRDVRVEPDVLNATRGLRAPGLGWPGRVKIGHWRKPGYRSFVVARRGERGVRLALHDQRFDELLVGLPDADAVAEAIRARTGS